MSGYPVWLVRRVYISGPDARAPVHNSEYCCAVSLPVPPTPGLGLPLDEGCDPVPVERVYVNHLGAVVCEMEQVTYKVPDELTPSEVAGQVAFNTRQFDLLDDGRSCPAYRLPAPDLANLVPINQLGRP